MTGLIMKGLISYTGKSFAIQIRTPPAEPTVCTEDPVEQLDYLISRGRKTGTGIVCFLICQFEFEG